MPPVLQLELLGQRLQESLFQVTLPLQLQQLVLLMLNVP
jgi:hypothetical protein